ncbi:MAG TPA: phosphopantetheine adenylyltransferase [Methanothermobacter sp.]|uniref:Phosphopantetheine adenylyltransferase n=1 Tax=Methanothermobacter tenebrarum TaxID=680118 RepID=A0ABM7YEM4_9EURY|nr:phosphopantetheine adenylyltransferase [Methanothermobacter tenebrarum]MDD3454877.1 phosphopantetheine adenylyltransferase [Methanobacteriales archaeon]MDI6881511.1 phosphopantetheine adenylyltransferase [Methanothermobacter sp.]MDX9694143.1 phosphopantetheine adenylyltransferase [Methanothermobacter sp.]BDH79787.1 phosphopantetheine adenylyltransferase [Methanothermobacter tenebrarum]HHW16693.1 phosphopantetheine adenylyltransferase [Methanothermobacter sp.]
MRKKYKLAAVGGTFDKFHKGHQTLLKKAFKVAETVAIGVTSDKFAAQKDPIEPCKKRIENLKKYLKKQGYKNFYIEKLEDPYGPTIDEEKFEAIIVSEETQPRAEQINKIRKEKKLPPLDIITISMVKAEDGRPISSTRIRRGEIDKKGKILKVI